MATRWPPPGQPLGSTQSGRRPTSGSKTRGPPPICFKCGCEGHFVVDCPMATASAPEYVASPRPISHIAFNLPGDTDKDTVLSLRLMLLSQISQMAV
jgi:hypothetical protein